MRAVNLIPADARKGGGAGLGGRSGGAAYVILGGLAVVVALVAVWALAGHNINTKRSELSRLQSETTAAQAESGRLAAYAKYAQISKDRVSTVRSLALSRFDWAQALDAVARTMPGNAWLTSMTGTVAPGVSVSGGGSSASSLRSQRQVPAIELVGCTTSQGNVGRLISRLRAVPGVDRVSIADTQKGEGSSGSTGGGSGGDCRGNHANWPQFDMVLFFGNSVPPAGPASPQTAGSTAPTTPAPAAPATTPNGSSSSPSTPTPASSPAPGTTGGTK